MGEVGATLGEPTEVAGPGRRHHDHPCATEMGSPAQIEAVTVEIDGIVEAPERAEQVGTNEQARRGEGEHVAHRVVLLLVGLTGLDDRVDLAEAVDRQADVLQHDGLVPVDELRPDDAGVRAVELLDEQTDRVRLECHVVVEEAEEAVIALDEPHHLVGGRAVPAVGLHGTDEGVRQCGSDLRGEVAQLAHHQEEVAQVGVVLRSEAGEHLGEPRGGLVHHHDRHDGGRELVGGLHEGARLAARTSCRPVTTGIVGPAGHPHPVLRSSMMNIFPSYDLTDFDLSRLDLERVARLARDTAYVAVGASVLGIRQANIRRLEAERLLRERAPEAATVLESTQQAATTVVRQLVASARLLR